MPTTRITNPHGAKSALGESRPNTIWYNATTSASYAQTGSVVKVNPGDDITETIRYTAGSGTIVASIVDENISGSSGESSITIARPFPNNPSLFNSWADFFTKAAAASRTSYILSTPLLDASKLPMWTNRPFVGHCRLRSTRYRFPGSSPLPRHSPSSSRTDSTAGSHWSRLDFRRPGRFIGGEEVRSVLGIPPFLC